MTLGGLDRPEEALSTYDEVVSRFGENEAPALLERVAKALFNKGVTLGGLDRPEEELSAYDEVVIRFGESEAPVLLEQVAKALFCRGVTLARGDPSGSEQDVEAMLAILPKLDSFPSAFLHALMTFSIDLGPARMRELIQASPAADLLLPLTTALEWELGLTPRVAREVEEVARDIQQDLAKRRDAGSNVGSV